MVPDGLVDQASMPASVWNKMPNEIRERIVDLAENETDQSIALAIRRARHCRLLGLAIVCCPTYKFHIAG